MEKGAGGTSPAPVHREQLVHEPSSRRTRTTSQRPSMCAAQMGRRSWPPSAQAYTPISLDALTPDRGAVVP